MDNYDELDNQRFKAEVSVVQQLNQAVGRNGLYITSSLIVLLLRKSTEIKDYKLSR